MPASLPDRRGIAAPADLAYCRSLLRGGSRSFFVASQLLPARVRDPAISLYAFCRVADDAIDAGGAGVPALEALRLRLDRIYEHGSLHHPADRALADVVDRFHLPRALLDGLLEGFAWDAAGRRYEDFADLCDYAARVAGTVGAMMALIMGQRAPAVVARACDLGIAMQLTNIARDVGEDARAGRLYLPRSWLVEAGIDPDAWLSQPVHTPALAAVVRRLLDEADRLYRNSEAGIVALPADCRGGIAAARLLYADIGREVARHGHDSVTARARVTGRRKAVLLARAFAWARVAPRAEVPHACSAAAAPFVAALAEMPTLVRQRYGIGSRAWMLARFVWVLDLFERLERADRLQRQPLV